MGIGKSWSEDNKQVDGVQRTQYSKSAETIQSRVDNMAHKPKMITRNQLNAENSMFPKGKGKFRDNEVCEA